MPRDAKSSNVRWLMLLMASLVFGMMAVTAGAQQMPEYAEDAEIKAPVTNTEKHHAPVNFMSSQRTPNSAPPVDRPVVRYAPKSPDPSQLAISHEGGATGADAAYSKAGSGGRRIWVFGDTLVGEVKDGKRTEPMLMFRNSVAVESKNGSLHYFWGDGSGDSAQSQQGAFVNTRAGEWYWPADFVLTQDHAYFFLRRIKTAAKTAGTGVFDFEVTGVDLAIASKFGDNPADWTMEYVALPELDASGLTPGIAATLKDGFIYLLATAVPDTGGAPVFYAGRMPEKALAKQDYRIHYYNAPTNSWGMAKPEVPLLNVGAPEASLVFDPVRNKWRMVYSKGNFSSDIVMRESPDIAQGWGEETLLYSCPETSWKRSYFCYAGKEIPDYHAGFPAITYSVNSTETADLNSDARIYVPRIIPVKLPQDTNATTESANEGDLEGATAGDFAEPVAKTPNNQRPYDSEGYSDDDTTRVSEDGYIFEK